MTISDAAEQVLFGHTLEEKLIISPIDLEDRPKGTGIKTPQAPQRPKELALSENGVRAQFPGVNTLDQKQSRGELLHFLANHELLASELMALVLLKFPNAPAEYRRGVYEAMREEQMHTLMYMRRMEDAGLEFGQLPLNSYFWRLVSPMQSPMEFVTKLNLTFEQANLDFSHHYAKLFRQVGDNSTASVLEKIYQDEIGHVGHGIHWLREWKNPSQSDWQTYSSGLERPFSASRAKGLAPFNREGRVAAGLDEDFISKLAVFSASRGRSPVLHWFNSNAESHAGAAALGKTYLPNSAEKAVEQDLELLMMAACKQDDILLLRRKPSIAHLSSLQRHGIHIPELVATDDSTLAERKLGGIIPWAWSPDTSEALLPLKQQVVSTVPLQWQEPHPPETFSKHLGTNLCKSLQIENSAKPYHDQDSIEKLLSETKQDLRMKLPYACSGRGQQRYLISKGITPSVRSFIQRGLQNQGCILIEPERERVCDFSIHYDLQKGQKAKLRGFCIMDNTPAGQFVSAHASPKWTAMLPPEIPAFLFQEHDFKALYYNKIPKALSELLPDYNGPLGIDAMIYRNEQGQLGFTPIVEVNARYTMGRLTLNLQRQLNLKQVSLTILPKEKTPPKGSFPLNDPLESTILQAYLQINGGES